MARIRPIPKPSTIVQLLEPHLSERGKKAEIARATGIHPSKFPAWMSGSVDPKTRQVDKVVEALGLEVRLVKPRKKK